MSHLPPPAAEGLNDATAEYIMLNREDIIRAGVLASLGTPTGLFRVTVLPLWDNNFRVNVLVGEDATAVRIPDSFFVTADEHGNILGTEPPIRKAY